MAHSQCSARAEHRKVDGSNPSGTTLIPSSVVLKVLMSGSPEATGVPMV